MEELEELMTLHRHQVGSQTVPGPQERPGSPHCSPASWRPLPQKAADDELKELELKREEDEDDEKTDEEERLEDSGQLQAWQEPGWAMALQVPSQQPRRMGQAWGDGLPLNWQGV
jgi:hypothetical protein